MGLNFNDVRPMIPLWEPDRFIGTTTVQRRFEFKTFAQTVAFVNDVAEWVASINHHPTVTFSYNKVTVRFSTYDKGAPAFTLSDVDAAAGVDRIFDGKGAFKS